jgi:hypothetical protein
VKNYAALLLPVLEKFGERMLVSSNIMKRTNAHWDDDLYSAGPDDLSITWFRAISPKSNPVIRVAVSGTFGRHHHRHRYSQINLTTLVAKRTSLRHYSYGAIFRSHQLPNVIVEF